MCVCEWESVFEWEREGMCVSGRERESVCA